MNNISNITFDSKKGHLKATKKEIKKLKKSINSLEERKKLLETNADSLEVAISKTTKLDPLNPMTQKTSTLWKLLFDMQYSSINGTYNEYKNAKINYAKEAVKNLDLLQYLKSPIQGQIKLFSKAGLNIAKNMFLDMFRIKTPEEKTLLNFYKEQKKLKTMQETLK